VPVARAPLRTCVGCKERAVKSRLVRLVVAGGEGVRVDRTGSAPGRGAYVHPDRDCVEAAVVGGAVSRALRVGLNEHRAATLRADLEGERLR
jgi:predicted RNA-binding protein YlxR (DUF448 family)